MIELKNACGTIPYRFVCPLITEGLLWGELTGHIHLELAESDTLIRTEQHKKKGKSKMDSKQKVKSKGIISSTGLPSLMLSEELRSSEDIAQRAVTTPDNLYKKRLSIGHKRNVISSKDN